MDGDGGSKLGEILKPLLLKRFLKLLSKLPGLLGFKEETGVAGVVPSSTAFFFLSDGRLTGEGAALLRNRVTDWGSLNFLRPELGVEMGLLWNQNESE